MSYNYRTQRPVVFTEDGQVMLLQVRDHVGTLLKTAGAFQMANAWTGIKGGYDCWDALACVDRLVELGEIREISEPGCAGQYRTFVGYPV